MAKVDPEQLEKEADELMAKLSGEAETPSEPETEPEEKEPATEEVEHTEETVEAEAHETEQLNPEVPEDTEVVEASEEVQDTEEVKDEPSEDQSPDDSVFEERYKNAQARMTKATQEAADLRKKMAEMEERLNFREQLQNQNTSAEKPEVDGDLKSLMEDYPDIAKPLINKINTLENQLNNTAQNQEQREEERIMAEHVAAIKAAHPDLDEVRTSDDFQGWMQRQSSFYQRIAEEGSAEDVIELLNVYKKAVGFDAPIVDSSSKKAAKLEAAKKVADPKLPKTRQSSSGNQKASFTVDEIARMTPKQFEKYEKEIDKAYSGGRIAID